MRLPNATIHTARNKKQSSIARSGPVLLLLILSVVLNGCASSSIRPAATRHPVSSSGQSLRMDAAAGLERDILTMHPQIQRDEARRAAVCATEYSQQLAREYRVIRPALLHNTLVNLGIRSRGLCYQWAEDLLLQLQALELETLQLRWGMTRVGTWREHNAIVITARGQPFNNGIVLDPWRRSGRLVWVPVRSDRYRWEEGELWPADQPEGSRAGR